MKKTLYCNNCKRCGMVYIISKKCISCILSLANKIYNTHCAFCFVNLFPNDTKSLEAKTSKELKNSNSYIK